MSSAADNSEHSWHDAPLPFQRLDASGTILAVNDAWQELLGYAPDEVVGTLYHDLVPEEHLTEFEHNMGRLFDEGRLDGAPCFVRRKDGVVRNVMVFARLHESANGQTIHCMFVDSTDLKAAERQLAESEARFRSLFEVAPTPIVIHDGREIVLANEAAAGFLGFGHAEELTGIPIADLVHPDSAAQVVERVKRMMAQDWVAPLSEETYVRRDGSPAYGETVASAVDFEGRRLIHVIAMPTSERRRTMQALAESEDRFRQLFESSVDSIVVHDGKRVLLANSAAMRRFGIAEGTDIRGLSIEQFIHPDSIGLAVGRMARLLTGQPPLPPIEVRLLRADGTTWEAEAVSAVLTMDDRRIIQTTFRDLTERKRTERELAAYREELERLVEVKTSSLVRAKADLAAITAVIGRTVEMRDPYTAGHQLRVAELATAIAREMGIPEDRVDALEVAARLHDVGKVAIPAEILSKPTRLSTLEYELIKTHPQAGYEIVSSANLHEPIAEIVYQHQERCDGSGYPRGLSAESLLPESCILMVADVFEAMASHRPYRPALGNDAAIAELLDGQGTRYDSNVVRVCVELVRNGFSFVQA